LSPEQIDSLYASSSVGIEKEEAVGFYVFPNPSSGRITIKAPRGKNIQWVTVTDILGRKMQHVFNGPATGPVVEMNLEQHANQGRQLMIVVVGIEDRVLFKKIIVD
jgi:hypothetical protein